MSETIEDRLAKVERELAILKARVNRDKSNWLNEIIGSCKDDPDFEGIVRLGKRCETRNCLIIPTTMPDR
jgi:hypothetical protein